MFSKILSFLFGKKANIFNDQGEVSHNLPEEKWSNWDKRYSAESSDWRNHKGTETPQK